MRSNTDNEKVHKIISVTNIEIFLIGQKILFYFLKDIIYLFFFGREKEWETSVCGCLLCAPTGDLAGNPDMCPDWELNQRPFSLQAGAQSTEPHQPGLERLVLKEHNSL